MTKLKKKKVEEIKDIGETLKTLTIYKKFDEILEKVDKISKKFDELKKIWLNKKKIWQN